MMYFPHNFIVFKYIHDILFGAPLNHEYLIKVPPSSSYFKQLRKVPPSSSYFKQLQKVPPSSSYFKQL